MWAEMVGGTRRYTGFLNHDDKRPNDRRWKEEHEEVAEMKQQSPLEGAGEPPADTDRPEEYQDPAWQGAEIDGEPDLIPRDRVDNGNDV